VKQFLIASILLLPALAACDGAGPSEPVASPIPIPGSGSTSLTIGDVHAKSLPDGSVLLTDLGPDSGADADNFGGVKYSPLSREKLPMHPVLGVCANAAAHVVDRGFWLEHPDAPAFAPQSRVTGPTAAKFEKVGKGSVLDVGGKRLATKGLDVVEYCFSPRGDSIATVSSDAVRFTPSSIDVIPGGGPGPRWAGPFHIEVFRVMDGARVGGPIRLGGEHVGPVMGIACGWSPDSHWLYVYQPDFGMELWIAHLEDALTLTPVQPAKGAVQDCWDRPVKSP
jgi:hypothetical protein